MIAADTRVRHARPLLWDALRTILPTPSQTQLLRACLLPGEPGRQAWKAWLRLSGPPRPRGRHDLTWPPRLLPLIDDAAERHGVELDPAVRTLLRAARYREALRSATYFRICREVLLVLDSARVPVVVLKGAALAATAYPHVALRHSHDIDLLVREADLRRAAGALAAAGFAESRRLLGGGAGDPRLVHESGLPVELHPRPFQTPCARDQSAEIWSRTVERRVADRPALVLSPADSLLQVCSQAAIAGGRGSLGWACDAWLLTARSPNLAWDLLAATAARAHLALPLYTLLRYLREELGAPIPDEVLRVLAGSAAGDPLGREIALAGARRGGRGAYPELLRRCESWREQRLILNWLVRPSPAFIRWDCPVPAARPLPLFQLYRAARHVGRRLRRARG